MRKAHVQRATKETQIEVDVNLDGGGQYHLDTGIGFFDHMLSHLSVHGLFDIDIKAVGDLDVDTHHTIEDVALSLGTAFNEALGNREGLARMGSAYVPMDETLGFVAVDLSGRPYAVVDIPWTGAEINTIPVTLLEHFFESFAIALRANIHVKVLYGRDDHHKA
ncbi:MAG: imidazoleglycerol-phosphate dehydratase, partial [Anaerolineae bacterium]|nr:imidazoleglycerol-phosphate dehydratase [Anaerolineae bacterium]